mmetsp:Transcript_43747/g.70321  ORF Transcript_43747/g.70321 Transcript_43747/m.70321 type:complete len:249 (+) Transcript_43747:243-989(+)
MNENEKVGTLRRRCCRCATRRRQSAAPHWTVDDSSELHSQSASASHAMRRRLVAMAKGSHVRTTRYGAAATLYDGGTACLLYTSPGGGGQAPESLSSPTDQSHLPPPPASTGWAGSPAHTSPAGTVSPLSTCDWSSSMDHGSISPPGMSTDPLRMVAPAPTTVGANLITICSTVWHVRSQSSPTVLRSPIVRRSNSRGNPNRHAFVPIFAPKARYSQMANTLPLRISNSASDVSITAIITIHLKWYAP